MTQNNLERIQDSNRLVKANARLLDERFKAEKSALDSRFFSRVSNVLLTVWELTALIVKLGQDESLVISHSGELYRGRIKTEKLTKLPGKLPGRKSLELDTEGFNEYIFSHSFVYAHGNPRKNAWEHQMIKEPKFSQNSVVEEVVEFLNHSNFADIHTNRVTDSRQIEYLEVSVKDHPVTLGICCKTNKVMYYIFQGKRTEV